MLPTDDMDGLRQKLTHAEAVIVELRDVVAELRKQIDSQQAHIHRLVKMTFGRGGERIEGLTLFDATAPPEATIPGTSRTSDPGFDSRDEAEGPWSSRQAEGSAASPGGDRPERSREGLSVLRHGQDPHWSEHQRTPRLPADGHLRPGTGPAHVCLSVVRTAGPRPADRQGGLAARTDPQERHRGRPARLRHSSQRSSITCHCTVRSRSWLATARTCVFRPSATIFGSAVNC